MFTQPSLAPSIYPSNLEMQGMSTWTYLEHHSYRTLFSNIPNLPRQFFTNFWEGFQNDDFPWIQFSLLGSGKLSEMMKRGSSTGILSLDSLLLTFFKPSNTWNAKLLKVLIYCLLKTFHLQMLHIQMCTWKIIIWLLSLLTVLFMILP